MALTGVPSFITHMYSSPCMSDAAVRASSADSPSFYTPTESQLFDVKLFHGIITFHTSLLSAYIHTAGHAIEES